MSLLDTASLIVTPNGYKEGKLYSVIPSDGSGDLSVTRATTATRVNSAGLVELVPYNLFKYSEQFDDVNWDKSSGAITANATTAPNGTTTADLYTANGSLSNHDFFQGFTGYAKTTSSIYVKKNTAQFVYISLNYQSSGVNWATGIYDLDNLTTVTFQSGGVTNQVASISDEGNGWRRITLSVDTADTALFCMYGVSDSMSPTLGSRGRVENSSSASFYAWGAQLNEGTIKPYQKTETRLNIPRLDYSNGTCPSLLVEPQRTNLLTYSSSFSNWLDAGGTVTSNTTIAPDGTMTADTLTGARYQGGGASNTWTFSCYAKKVDGDNKFLLRLDVPSTNIAQFDLSTGVIDAISSGYSATINAVGNGWYRCTLTTPPSTSINNIVLVSASGSTYSTYVWGAQIEVGNYATSYIPTTYASVTRNADVISKTGISSLIGQTEGTLFVELDIINGAESLGIWMRTGVTPYNDMITIHVSQFGTCVAEVRASNVTQFTNSSFSIGSGKHKFALAYKANDFAFYIDGTQIATSSSGTPPTCDQVYLGGYPDGGSRLSKNAASALWKTRLTNAQLAQLTTI